LDKSRHSIFLINYKIIIGFDFNGHKNNSFSTKQMLYLLKVLFAIYFMFSNKRVK